MKKLKVFLARLAGLFRKDWREKELAREFESHLQMHIDDCIRVGMSPEDARREARLRFGAMEATKESVRETSRLMWLETAWQDLRYALRGLRLNPAFSVAGILSLTLGIGASVAIFTVADNLLLRPLPYPNPSQLVMLWEDNPHNNFHHNSVSPGNYFDWKSQNTVFESIGAFYDYHVIFSDGHRSEEVDIESVAGEVLPLLGVHPVRGRLFTLEEEQKGAQLAVISYRMWQTWFGGDESAIGRQVQINARPWTIAGVLPADFYFHSRTVDAWLPIGLKPAEDLRKTQGRWIYSIGRLHPGVTVRQAQSQMSSIAQRLEIAYPEFDKNWGIVLEPLRDSLVGEVKASLLVLLGAVTLLLAVACANVANLLLARYSVRRREMAVRGALGAGRGRLVRQLLTESLVLAGAGGALGIVLARIAVIALVALAPRDLTQSLTVSFDLRIVAFALGLSLLTGIIFGLAPALLASQSDLNRDLHAESRAATGTGGRLRNFLVGAEIACSVALLAGAGLLFRTVMGLQSVDSGIDASNLLTFRVTLPNVRYPQTPQRRQFFEQAAQQLAQLPGVTSASAISYLPFNGLAAGTDFEVEGRPPARPGEGLNTVVRTVLPGYFHTMGIPFESGRDFTAADNVESAPPRFVVSQALVKKYFPGEQPLGHRIRVDMGDKNPMGEIIGVVADVKEGSLDQEPSPTVYYVLAHLPYTGMVFVVRAANDPMALAEPAQRIVHGLDPAQPIAEVRSMETVLRSTFARQQFSAALLSGFSVTSLLLATIGIYGVLAYAVSQRTREIGVRMALGANPGQIVRMVVQTGARIVLGGALAGIAGALALSGLLKNLLFGIGPRDPVTFVVAPCVLILAAMMAAYFPARRASHVSPTEALRSE